MKNFVLVLLFNSLTLMIKAQQISTEVTTQYAASVIIRVHDVAQRITITNPKQKELAEHFQKEDSLAKKMILSGASTSAIDSLQLIMRANFQNILGAEKSNEYYSSKFSVQAYREGKVLSKIFKEKFNSDSALNAKVEKLYTLQRLNISKAIYSQYKDTTVLYDRLYQVSLAYDTILNKYSNSASSLSYIDSKIKVMNKVKPMSQVLQASLENKFLQLNYVRKQDSYADNFIDALHLVTSDTVYYATLFRNEIDRKASFNAAHIIKRMKRKNEISPAGAIELLPILKRKEKQIATVGFAFTNRIIIDSLSDIIDEAYSSLENGVLLRDGSGLPSSQFAIALKYKTVLVLTPSQVDSLLAKAIILKQMKDSFLVKEPFGKYDSKAFESGNMVKIVSEEQYTKVLKIKNRSQAENDAQKDWDELVLRKLSSHYNMETTISKLKNYYMAKWCAYYRYGNDKLLQTANVKAIENNMPAALKALRFARKQNTLTTNENGSQYQW
jgi:hypothetical protein